MRSLAEIAFRARQELKNAYWFANPPRPAIDPSFTPRFAVPDPEATARALAGSAFESEIVALAEQIRQHRFPIFGLTIDTGPTIPWRRDPLSGVETNPVYFRRIRYLDARRAGDHKMIWELNRHQHLVLLAQAYLFTGDAANLEEIRAQLESWFIENPYQRGMNWTSALEVAFRALSWMWVYHMVGAKFPVAFRVEWLKQLYLHGLYLENNLSFYFSPNNHLVGEALALHALGLFFAGHKRAMRWEQTGARIMREEMERQVHNDGSNFEQSAYYHVYALDMFLFHAILAKPDRPYMDKLEKMVDYLHALLGPARRQPAIGDDDGGRLFHPFGARDQFGRATIATASLLFDRSGWAFDSGDLLPQAAWWLGAGALQRGAGDGTWGSRLFPDAGVAVMTSGRQHIIVDAGPFGPRGGGHSHADTLSIVARCGGDDILIDPGTYTYTNDSRWRDWFRGTEAHNTIRIDGRNQAMPAGPFRWTDPPEVRILDWKTNAERDLLEAECRFKGFTHRRRVEFHKPHTIVVVDDVSGPAGENDVEQIWHLGTPEARSRLTLADGAEMVESYRSPVFGEKHSSPMVRVRRRSALPVRLEAAIDLS